MSTQPFDSSPDRPAPICAGLRVSPAIAAARRGCAWPSLAPLILALALLLGCGYGMDAPRLPNNHRTLALDPVRNRTYEGELDVRLRQALRRILYRTAGVEMVSPEDSGLLLILEIQQLDLVRARSLDSTDVKRLNYHIAGTMTLKEQGTGRLLLDKLPVALNTRYDLPEAAVETPAVRDDAVNDVVSQFAEAIVARLLVNFEPEELPPPKPSAAPPAPQTPDAKPPATAAPNRESAPPKPEKTRD
jgi:hypothetical protein